MYRRIIWPLQAPQFDQKGDIISPVINIPEGKGFYAKLGEQIAGCLDYLTTNEVVPPDALYVCEERSPTEYVVTVNTPGLVSPHDYAGWPAVDGTQRVTE